MPFITSRVNGLKIAIPNDARNVIHRFAISGGGNELVFEPPTRKAYNASKQSDTQVTKISEPDEPIGSDREDAVQLSVTVAEDEKPKRTRRPASKKEAPSEEVTL